MFSVGYLNPSGNVYDVAPDGQRFIITTLPQTTAELKK
jgi:hypothetical protein